MVNSGTLTLPEVQAILRHANIQTTSHYLKSQELHQTGEKLKADYDRAVRVITSIDAATGATETEENT